MEFDQVDVVVDGNTLVSLQPELGDYEDTIGGKVRVLDQSGATVVALSTTSDVTGPAGAVFIRAGAFRITDGGGEARLLLHGGDPMAGEDGGVVHLHAGDEDPGHDHQAIALDATSRSFVIRDKSGDMRVEIDQHDIILRNSKGEQRIRLDADTSDVTLGGADRNGALYLRDDKGKTRAVLGTGLSIRADDGTTVIAKLGPQGNLVLGGAGRDGDLLLNDTNGARTIELGGDEQRLLIQRPDGTKIVQLGRHGNLFLGGGDVDGDIQLFPKGANQDDENDWTIHLDGDSGDIFLRNADCAEDFDVLGSADPGSVMVIAGEASLRASDRAYDRRVAGVLSGAGGMRPGIVLGRQARTTGRAALALAGKVLCLVDADLSPVETGDLLTTSDTRAHAMLARDSVLSFGSVIGKALAPLRGGRALVPVLVGLQ